MPSFAYTARDRVGKKSNGVVSAKDLVEARQSLRNKELFVTSIKQQVERPETASSGGLFRPRKVKLGDMVVMSRQLSTLVRAGLSIVECLHACSVQCENALLGSVMQDVRYDVLTGHTLNEAMRRHPKVFTEQYVALVQAGETGGVLEQTLDIAAEQFDKEADLREKVKSAFVYPMVVLVASVGVVIFMLIFIVPVFAKVYDQFHANLPPVTQLLVTLSGVIIHDWWAVLISAYVLFRLIKAYIQVPAGRRIYDKIKLKLPLLGKLNRKIAVARFTQTFGGATKAGVPILRALEIASRTSGNVIIMEAVDKVIGFVKEGLPLAAPLEQTGEFPTMMTRMVAAGEQSGNLDEMLSEVTRFYNRDIEYSVAKLTRVLEPAMTVVVGGIVLFVLLALYMPIFNLSSVVRR